MNNNFTPIEFKNDKLVLINQTLLPLCEEFIVTDDYERIAESIEALEVRGAPAIGIAAAYAIALSHKNISYKSESIFKSAFDRLKSTRPTAVNLFWALNEMKIVFDDIQDNANSYNILLNKAIEIHEDDISKCDNIAKNGIPIFKNKKNTVLTHCNTGKLATGGGGTALHVIKNGFDNGLVDHVYADETRPLLQGSRLTAFELSKAEIPFSINTDSMAAMLMQQKIIDFVIVGADRIALNGDSANKIGTYNLAVLCKYHNIPFYIAAPTSTIDKNCETGNDIKIEMRDSSEIFKINNVQITSESYDYFCPSFDVTPNNLISGIVTEKQFHSSPFDFSHV